MEKRRNLMWIVLSGCVSLVPIWVMFTYGSNIPLGDQWMTPGWFVQSLHNGTESLEALFLQHNESRKAVTRVLWGYPIYWWGWNTRLELMMTWVSVGCISMVLWGLLGKTHDIPSAWKGPLFFVMNVLMFSLASWEYWIWSLSVEAYIPTLALAASILVSRSRAPSWVFWGVSILGTFLAIFSYANGLFLIPIMLYVGILRTLSPRRQKESLLANGAGAALFLTVAIACVGIYFSNYQTPGHHDGVQKGFEIPLQVGHFWARWLSAPISAAMGEKSYFFADVFGPVFLIVYVGLLVVLGVMYLRHRQDTDSFVIWSPLIGFAMVSGLVTSLSRASMDMTLWRSSRYICFSVFGLVAALPMGVALLQRLPKRFTRVPVKWVNVPLALGLVSVVVMSGLNSRHALEIIKDQKEMYDDAEDYLTLRKAGFSSNTQLPKLQTYTDTFLSLIDWFHQHGYVDLPEVKLPDAPERASAARGFVDHVTFQADGTLSVRGWTLPYENHLLTLIGKNGEGQWSPVFCFPHLNHPRPDVPEALNLDGYELSGFHWDIPPEYLKGDIQEWQLMVWNSDDRQFRQLAKGGFTKK